MRAFALRTKSRFFKSFSLNANALNVYRFGHLPPIFGRWGLQPKQEEVESWHQAGSAYCDLLIYKKNKYYETKLFDNFFTPSWKFLRSRRLIWPTLLSDYYQQIISKIGLNHSLDERWMYKIKYNEYTQFCFYEELVVKYRFWEISMLRT